MIKINIINNNISNLASISPNLFKDKKVITRKFSTVNTQSTKEQFFIDAWITDFPSYSHIDYPTLAGLASRSQKIGTWFEHTKQAYILSLSRPSWYEGDPSSSKEWSDEMTSKLLFVKGIHSSRGPQLLKVSLQLKKEMNRINSEIDNRIKDELKTCPELVIELFTVSILPIETHFKALEFHTKEEASEYLNKELHNFKVLTYRKFVSGELSADDLIGMLYSKL
jgi:hypothetical protein